MIDDRDYVAEITYTEFVTEHNGFRVYETGWSDGEIEYQFYPVRAVAKNVMPVTSLERIGDAIEEDTLIEMIDEYNETHGSDRGGAT